MISWNAWRHEAYVDVTILVSPQGPTFAKLVSFATAHEIHHNLSLRLYLHVFSRAAQLPDGDLTAMRIRQNQGSNRLAAASSRRLNLTDMRNDPCNVDAKRRVQLPEDFKRGNTVDAAAQSGQTRYIRV